MLPCVKVHVRHPASQPAPDEGVRVLVDRRWPPGLRRDQVEADLWLREVAPSDALLRRGDAGGWDGELGFLYRRELQGCADLLRVMARLHAESRLTLLTCASSEASAACVLSRIIEELAGGDVVA